MRAGAADIERPESVEHRHLLAALAANPFGPSTPRLLAQLDRLRIHRVSPLATASLSGPD